MLKDAILLNMFLEKHIFFSAFSRIFFKSLTLKLSQLFVKTRLLALVSFLDVVNKKRGHFFVLKNLAQ